MTKRITNVMKGFILFILFLFIAGCIIMEGTGNLNLTIRTNHEQIGNITFFITLTGPDDQIVTKETDEKEILFEELTTGFWGIDIEAVDDDDTVVADESDHIFIIKDETTEKTISIEIPPIPSTPEPTLEATLEATPEPTPEMIESTDPEDAVASVSSLYLGNSSTLSVIGGSLGTGASWEWYSGSCGGTHVGTGSSINVAPTNTTTYYVRAEGCTNTECAQVEVTVNNSVTFTDIGEHTFILESVPGFTITSTTITVIGAGGGGDGKNVFGMDQRCSCNKSGGGGGAGQINVYQYDNNEYRIMVNTLYTVVVGEGGAGGSGGSSSCSDSSNGGNGGKSSVQGSFDPGYGGDATIFAEGGSGAQGDSGGNGYPGGTNSTDSCSDFNGIPGSGGNNGNGYGRGGNGSSNTGHAQNGQNGAVIIEWDGEFSE